MLASHRRRTLIALAGLAAGLAASGAWAETHRHDHGGAPGQLTLNAGKKWPTDAPLRTGMENIRETMAHSLHGIHEGKLSGQKYGELARKVNAEVGHIVANCKLAPEADAQLHLVIADIVEGVEAMEGKARKRQSGAVKVVSALEKYGAYFDHPGWKPLEH